MKIWNLVLLLALFAVQSLDARIPEVNTLTTTNPLLSKTCTIGSPTNFRTIEVSTSWANLAWTPVQGASQYLIKTFDRLNGQEVHSVTVSGSATSVQITWPDASSGSFESKAWSIDLQGNLSESPALLVLDKIILEIVGTGLQAGQTPTPNGCVLQNPSTSCSVFNWGAEYTTTYEIYQSEAPNPVVKFTITGYLGENNMRYVRLSYKQVPPLKCKTSPGKTSFLLNWLTVDFATLTVSQNTATPTPFGELRRSASDDFSYIIAKVPGGDNSKPSITVNRLDQRDLDPTLSDLKTIPNPFHDILSLELPDTDNQAAANVYLYDLLGAVKRTFAAPADQRTITFDTADLTPGVYFLRVETGGRIETIKVVKTQ